MTKTKCAASVLLALALPLTLAGCGDDLNQDGLFRDWLDDHPLTYGEVYDVGSEGANFGSGMRSVSIRVRLEDPDDMSDQALQTQVSTTMDELCEWESPAPDVTTTFHTFEQLGEREDVRLKCGQPYEQYLDYLYAIDTMPGRTHEESEDAADDSVYQLADVRDIEPAARAYFEALEALWAADGSERTSEWLMLIAPGVTVRLGQHRPEHTAVPLTTWLAQTERALAVAPQGYQVSVQIPAGRCVPLANDEAEWCDDETLPSLTVGLMDPGAFRSDARDAETQAAVEQLAQALGGTVDPMPGVPQIIFGQGSKTITELRERDRERSE